MSTTSRAATGFAPVLAALAAVAACGAGMKVADLVLGGEARELRKRPDDAPRTSAGHPPILLIALDGVDRRLLYDLLRKDELPALEGLLGGSGGRFPHAHFDETMLSTLPSSTMAAWTTAMTGVPPATHGVTGNEFFIREERRLAAPAPVGFDDAKPTLSIYTDGYLDALRYPVSTTACASASPTFSYGSRCTRSSPEPTSSSSPNRPSWCRRSSIFSCSWAPVAT